MAHAAGKDTTRPDRTGCGTQVGTQPCFEAPTPDIIELRFDDFNAVSEVRGWLTRLAAISVRAMPVCGLATSRLADSHRHRMLRERMR